MIWFTVTSLNEVFPVNRGKSCQIFLILVEYIYIHHIPFKIGHSWKYYFKGGEWMKKEDEKDMSTQTPIIETQQELSFEEKIRQLSRPIKTVCIGENSDQICREVRGKE